jgi:hypothetical protein
MIRSFQAVSLSNIVSSAGVGAGSFSRTFLSRERMLEQPSSSLEGRNPHRMQVWFSAIFLNPHSWQQAVICIPLIEESIQIYRLFSGAIF